MVDFNYELISRNSDVQLTDTQARKFFCEKGKHHWPLCHRLRMMFVCRGTLSTTSSVDWHDAFSRNLGRDALNDRQTHNKLPSKPCWQGRITEMPVFSYDASNSQRSQCTSLGQRGRNTCISKPCSVTPSSSVGEIGDIKWTTWCSNYSKRYVTKTLLCNGSSPTRSPAASMGRRSGAVTIPNVFVPQHKSGLMNCHLQDRKAGVRQHGLTKLLLMQSFRLYSQGANCFQKTQCRRTLFQRRTFCSMLGLVVGHGGHNRLVLACTCTFGSLQRRTWGSCAKPCEHYDAKELFLTGVHPRKFGACCFFHQSTAVEAHLCRRSFMAKLRLDSCTHWSKQEHHNAYLLCGTFHARLSWTSATTSLAAVGRGSFICYVLSEKLTFINCGREQCQDMHIMLAVSFATAVASKQSHSSVALTGASNMQGWGTSLCSMMLRMLFPHRLMTPWMQQCANMPVLTMWSCSCRGTAKLIYFCETHSGLHTQSCRWAAGICRVIAWPLHSSCLCTFQQLKSGTSHVKRYRTERRFLPQIRSLATAATPHSALLRMMLPKHMPYQRHRSLRPSSPAWTLAWTAVCKDWAWLRTMTRRNSFFGSWVRERRRPCKTFTMFAQQLGVSSRGLPNIWEAGCITLAPRLLKSQCALRRPSGHGVYSRGFGLGGMLPERSDSLFSKPWFCRQCIQVWTQCHRTRVMTNALHSYWLRCPASCCKAVHAQNRGRMYEGITAVGPTRKCSKKWVCSPLPRKGVFGVCSGGKILSEGLKKMLHCWLACLGSFLGRPTRSSVLMAAPRSMQTHGYCSLLKTCACYVALTCQHQASYMINRCCCFPHRTKLFFCPCGSGDFSSRPRPCCQSKRLTAVSSLEIMLVTVVQMQLLRHLSSLVDMLAQTEWHVIMWQAQQLPCRHTDTERMASSSWLDKSLSATSARGVAEYLHLLKSLADMCTRVLLKVLVLERVGVPLATWSAFGRQNDWSAQSAYIMLPVWMPCISMLQEGKVSCSSTSDQRNQLGCEASDGPSSRSALTAMNAWFAAPAPASTNERQVRPRVGGSSKEQEQLLKAVAKLTLRNAQACRNMESTVFVTYILPKAGTYSTAGTEAGQLYAQRTRAAGKNHTLGQPSSWLWAAFMKVLATDENISAEKRQQVKSYCDEVTDPCSLSQTVLYCRLSKVYDQSKVRLQVAVTPELQEFLTELQRGLEASGGERKFGPPPRGALERHVQELLGENSGPSVE